MKALSFRRLAMFALAALFIAASLIGTTGAASASTVAGTQQAAQAAQSMCTYKVQYGDTLYSIAARYHTTVWELMRINFLSYWGWLYAGTTLRVPCNPDDGGNTSCTYRASYIADITVPDGAAVIAGSHFPKIWRVRNTGSCVWGPGRALHSLAWVGGTQMGAPSPVDFNAIVYPGHDVDLVVPMVAPSLAGRYLSEWKLKIDGRGLIGVGSSDRALYVDFIVPEAYPPAPSRIQFAPGATSAVVNGATKNGQSVRYVLWARAGQEMSVNLLGIVPTPAALAVSGEDGSLLLPSIYGKTSFSSTLPKSQDYYITITPKTNDTVQFALQVIIK